MVLLDFCCGAKAHRLRAENRYCGETGLGFWLKAYTLYHKGFPDVAGMELVLLKYPRLRFPIMAN